MRVLKVEIKDEAQIEVAVAAVTIVLASRVLQLRSTGVLQAPRVRKDVPNALFATGSITRMNVVQKCP
jgi:hypothetical protein